MRRKQAIWKDGNGFTLVEVLAVLVIIAILAAVTIPTMAGFIDDARKKSYTAAARSVYVAAQAAATEFAGDKAFEKGNQGGGVRPDAEEETRSYASSDDSSYIRRVKELLADDVGEGSVYTITLSGSRVNKVSFTPENGETVTIVSGEGVTYGEK